MDYVNDYLKRHEEYHEYKSGVHTRTFKKLAPQMRLADGTTVSVQASETHYCTPRMNDVYKYSAVEVGFPSRVIPEIMKYCEDKDDPLKTVYGYVPVEIMNAVIEAAGGIVEE